MDPPRHEKLEDVSPDCPYSCCTPYTLDAMMGKDAMLPQTAAIELRRFRHRIDYENQVISEHALFFDIIVNASRVRQTSKIYKNFWF